MPMLHLILSPLKNLLFSMLCALITTISVSTVWAEGETIDCIKLEGTSVQCSVVFANKKPHAGALLADDRTNFEVRENGVTLLPTAYQTAGVESGDKKTFDAYVVLIFTFDADSEYVITPLHPTLGTEVVLHSPKQGVGVGERELPAEGFRLLDSQYLVLDVKTAEDGDSDFAAGLDYYLRFSRDSDPLLANASINLLSNGYLIFPDNGADGTNVTSELNIAWDYFDLPRLGDAHLDLRNPETWARLKETGKGDPLHVTVDAHFKHEASQDFDDYQFAAGLKGSATLPLPRLAQVPILLLPLAPFLLIDRSYLAAIQQPYYGLAVDYVFQADESERAAVTDDAEYPRVVFDVGWTTEVFRPNTWLYVQSALWYEIAAPDAVQDADDDFNHFVDAGLKIPLGDRSTHRFAIVKYVTGSLPPNFESDDQVSAGFEVAFD